MSLPTLEVTLDEHPYPTWNDIFVAVLEDTGSVGFSGAYADELADHLRAEWEAESASEIAAEEGYERWLETRYAEDIQADEDYERRMIGA